MLKLVKQFQPYLNETQKGLFGTIFAVDVLISNKTLVQGNYLHGLLYTILFIFLSIKYI
jgi:hypothetical protein